jgi:hypothetical protein
MTREEVLYIANRRGKSCYDLMLEVCKELESRTCDSCKYFLIYDGSKQAGTCDNEESIAYTSKESIYGDDGCNKWESKDTAISKMETTKKENK